MILFFCFLARRKITSFILVNYKITETYLNQSESEKNVDLAHLSNFRLMLKNCF